MQDLLEWLALQPLCKQKLWYRLELQAEIATEMVNCPSVTEGIRETISHNSGENMARIAKRQQAIRQPFRTVAGQQPG